MFRAIVIAAVIALAVLLVWDRKPSGTQTASVTENPAAFCDAPAPPPPDRAIKQRPAATVFGEMDAMVSEFYRTGIKTIPLKTIDEIILQLQAMHGTADCTVAASHLVNARTIRRAAVVAEMDRRELERVANDAAGRIAWANETEHKFLSQGQDYRIEAFGPKATSLRIKWVLIGRPYVYKAMNEGDLAGNLRKRGFKKVIFTDGYDAAWTYDLSK